MLCSYLQVDKYICLSSDDIDCYKMTNISNTFYRNLFSLYYGILISFFFAIGPFIKPLS